MSKRRNLLKTLSVLGAAGAVETWKKPVVNSVLLPAHAASSPADPPVTTAPPETTSPPTGPTVFDLSEAFPARGDGSAFVDCAGRQLYPDLVITNPLSSAVDLVVIDGGGVDDWLQIDGAKLPGWVCGINTYPTGTVFKSNIPPGGTVTIEHWDFASPGTSANIIVELQPVV